MHTTGDGCNTSYDNENDTLRYDDYSIPLSEDRSDMRPKADADEANAINRWYCATARIGPANNMSPRQRVLIAP